MGMLATSNFSLPLTPPPFIITLLTFTNCALLAPFQENKTIIIIERGSLT